ncbi:hypothetical protein [Kocuria sp. ZOR0020]|uniref:hypothetical protein n=1 Tax=Kocuria sp. ZOR0020 TaxID=1339234 RepID=UPI0012E0A9B7|nr:hypothetical protein [Kocuria sp. ZOR0020]
MTNYLNHVLSQREYADVSFLSCPDIVTKLTVPSEVKIDYEFHSSNMTIVADEISNLELSKLNRLIVPSVYMATQLEPLLPTDHVDQVTVVPNLVDTSVFTFDEALEEPAQISSRPLIWVGRFDKGKGYRYFLRLLAQLPDNYHGVVIVSLETGPDRAA